jgi:hypothetical protein
MGLCGPVFPIKGLTKRLNRIQSCKTLILYWKRSESLIRNRWRTRINKYRGHLDKLCDTECILRVHVCKRKHFNDGIKTEWTTASVCVCVSVLACETAENALMKCVYSLHCIIPLWSSCFRLKGHASKLFETLISCELYLNMLFLPQNKHTAAYCGCVTNMYHLILFRKIISVCCEKLTVFVFKK